MAIFAGFVGIDRYADPRIRDLSGARRDALALGTILADSLPGLTPIQLLDQDATGSALLQMLDATLGVAGPDDVVILAFAGHGTPDHHLVVADSRCDDIPGTAIPMSVLAERFGDSKAGCVFCILDCCFSGGAPARVLEDAPGLRHSPLPFDTVAGKGRILLAASNVDEPALEDPISRHGLFTKAMLDALQAAPAPVSLIAIADQVSRDVRAAAARLGYVQTPVLFGHVEGEVTFPAIRRGGNFYAAFPEQQPIKVSSSFDDLAGLGVSPDVIALWKSRFPGGLNPLQISAINECGVLLGQSLLTVAPTSSGKTFIGEMAAIRSIQQGQKAVLLLPYKAIVNEKFEEFTELYGSRLGLRVARCSGDWQDQTGAILRGKYDIAFFTYETFLGLSISQPHLLAQIGLVVVDEVQFITDQHRGIIVELLLTNLIAARRRGVAPQLLALSAVIGNTNAFERWLGCGLQVHTQRPVPLQEGVLDRSGTLQALEPDGSVTETRLLAHGEVQVRRKEASSQDVIVPLVRHLVRDGEKVLVFRNTRGPTSGCAAYLASELGLPPAQSVLDALPQLDMSADSQKLRECLQGGTAFHSSNLQRDERGIVEAAFRDPNGEVRVLVATSTLAAGVNTPASTVVIVETGFRGEGGETPYSVATYKNMAGRAGRLGFEARGRSIVLADTYMERNRLFRKYVQGTPEPIRSSFDPRNSGTWLIRLLTQVGKVRRDQVVELVAGTYGGFLANMAQSGWSARFAAQTSDLLRRMEADGLLEADGPDHIRLSILGQACGQSPLALESTLQLVEILRRVEPVDLHPETLLTLIQALPEQDADYTPIGRGTADSRRPSELVARLGSTFVYSLQRGARDDRTYYARCKRALVLADWIDGVQLDEIERRYSVNAFSTMGHGDIRGYADASRFYLASAARIAAIVHPGVVTTQEQLDELLKRLDLGLPSVALPLTAMKITFSRGECLTLANSGIQSEDALRAAGARRIEELLGKGRADLVIRALAVEGA